MQVIIRVRDTISDVIMGEEMLRFRASGELSAVTTDEFINPPTRKKLDIPKSPNIFACIDVSAGFHGVSYFFGS